MELARDTTEFFEHVEPLSSATRGWTAIVMAGERPGGDPLARALKVPMKALINVAGTTLLDHVLHALFQVDRIEHIVVLSQDLETLAEFDPFCSLGHRKLSLIRSSDSIANSIRTVVGTSDAPWPVLVTTADNALLTPERIERFIGQVGISDLAIGVGKRDIVERNFPETIRTWLKFSDGHYSGANLFAFTSQRSEEALKFWSDIEGDRKKGLKLMASFGPGLLLRALTRSISFPIALKRVSCRLGFDVRPVVLDAEAPIDVDKIGDLAIVEKVLSARVGENLIVNTDEI